MLRDIRELADDPEAYAAELNRRWGGLLSYRYLGRSYSSMDVGAQDTVAIRHDMRNPTGGLFLAVLGIVSPDSGLVSDLEAVPNPVIHSIQVLDPGRDVRRIEIQSEDLKRGRQMAYSRSQIVDADNPARVLALNEGQGVSIGMPPEGLGKMELEPDRGRRLPRPAAAVAGVRRRRRTDGALGAAASSPSRWPHPTPHCTSGRSSWSLETAALDAAAAAGRHRPAAGAQLARDVPGPRQDRPVPGRRRSRFAAPTAPSRCGPLLHDEGAGDKPITTGSYLFRGGLMSAPVLLLDGASMWFRSFFGVPSSITAPDGRPVNAVRGFLDSVATLITRERPHRLVVCLDLDWRPQFRVDAIPSYKAHRVAEETAQRRSQIWRKCPTS